MKTPEAVESFMKNATGRSDNNPPVHQTQIRFPFRVRPGIDENTVVMDVPLIEGPMFTELTLNYLTAGMSDREADQLLDQMVALVIRESIKAKINVY